MKLHDVSILISEDMPIWPNDPVISMERLIVYLWEIVPT
jgi:kynurenine formamidase